MINLILRIIKFLLIRKKIWLLPIILVFLLFGFIFVATQGTVFAPVIYTIF
jgi:hypothetical protein